MISQHDFIFINICLEKREREREIRSEHNKVYDSKIRYVVSDWVDKYKFSKNE